MRENSKIYLNDSLQQNNLIKVSIILQNDCYSSMLMSHFTTVTSIPNQMISKANGTFEKTMYILLK